MKRKYDGWIIVLFNKACMYKKYTHTHRHSHTNKNRNDAFLILLNLYESICCFADSI